MQIKVNNAAEFFEMARHNISQIKNNIVSTLAKEAAKEIANKSGGQLTPSVAYEPNGAVVGVYSIPDGGEGVDPIEIERMTGAFALTYTNLSNKSYVVNLINKDQE